jgi:hypothetical protein
MNGRYLSLICEHLRNLRRKKFDRKIQIDTIVDVLYHSYQIQHTGGQVT